MRKSGVLLAGIILLLGATIGLAKPSSAPGMKGGWYDWESIRYDSAPAVSETTKVTDLNADLLDGYDWDDGQDVGFGIITLTETTQPATPSAGTLTLYATNDSVYYIDENGNASQVGVAADQVEDFRAINLNMPSSTSPITAGAPLNNISGISMLIKCRDFDDTDEEGVCGSFEIEEGFDTAGSVIFEFCGMSETVPATAKNVAFKFYWIAVSDSGSYATSPSSFTTADLAVDLTQNDRDRFTHTVANSTLSWAAYDEIFFEWTRVDSSADDLVGDWKGTKILFYLPRS